MRCFELIKYSYYGYFEFCQVIHISISLGSIFWTFILFLCLAFVAQLLHFPLFCVDICALEKIATSSSLHTLAHAEDFTRDSTRVSVGLSSLHANPNCYHCS